MSPEKTEKDHLKELIRKSGLPLELEISSFLNSKEGWTVSANAGYLDKDSNKGREIDVSARICIEEDVNEEMCFHYVKLLIQCKKIPGNAWVFVKPSFEVLRPLHTSVNPIDVFGLNFMEPYSDAFPSVPQLHYLRDCPIAIYSKEYVLDEKKSNRRNDNLHGAVVSLAKATSFEVEQEGEDVKAEALGATCPPDWITNIFPIIVFDGKMYLAEKKEDFILTPAEHVVLSSRYFSGQYNIDFGIDIVHRNAFKSFFKEIDKDIELLRQNLGTTEMQQFRKLVKRTAESYKETYMHGKRKG